MKYSVFGFSNGSHMLFYERNLVGGFSVEAGLGITFKDVLGSFFESYFNRGIEKSEHRYAHGVPFEEFEDYRRTVMGNSYSIFVRKYFGENYGDHLSGLYVGLGFDQRSHYSEVSESYWQERGIVLSTFNPEREVRRVSNFTAVVGTQAYFSSTVTYDAAVYVGYRQTVNNFVRNHETLTSGQSPDEQFYMEERNCSGLTVMFTLKAGFAF